MNPELDDLTKECKKSPNVDDLTQRCDVEEVDEEFLTTKSFSSAICNEIEEENEFEKEQKGLGTLFYFIGDINSVNNRVLLRLRDMINLLKHLKKNKHELSILGVNSNIKWIADFCWNISAYLLNDNDGKSSTDLNERRKNKNTHLILAAEILELSDYLYENIELDDVTKKQSYQTIRATQSIVLLVAAASRLDYYQNLMVENNSQNNITLIEPDKTLICNTSENFILDQCLIDVRRAYQLMVMNGGYKETRLKDHLKLALLLEFKNLSYRFNNHEAASTNTSELIEPLQNIDNVKRFF